MALISARCNTKPPIQEADVSGNVREKETISRYRAGKMYAATPRDTSLAPGADGARLTTRSPRLFSVCSRKSVINFRSYAYNRIESRSHKAGATASCLPNARELSCINCKQYKIYRIDREGERERANPPCTLRQ